MAEIRSKIVLLDFVFDYRDLSIAIANERWVDPLLHCSKGVGEALRLDPSLSQARPVSPAGIHSSRYRYRYRFSLSIHSQSLS